MELTAVPLTSGNDFVDDEGWLVDYFNPNAKATSPMSWVEAGELNEGFGTYYFWAYGWKYGTPDGVFMSYPLGPIAQSDLDHATEIAYKIEQNATNQSQTNVRISKAASGSLLFTGQCSTCSMSPNTVIEGQELAGSADAEAPLAFFGLNEVINGTSESLRNDDGTVSADLPPKADWWIQSKPSQTSDGGLFYTYCCAPKN